jgi:hypothetical protein
MGPNAAHLVTRCHTVLAFKIIDDPVVPLRSLVESISGGTSRSQRAMTWALRR